MLKNLKGAQGLKHLVQSFKDNGLTYQEASEYLRKHGADIDEDEEDLGKTSKVLKEGQKFLTYEEMLKLYRNLTEEQGGKRAFEILNTNVKLRNM